LWGLSDALEPCIRDPWQPFVVKALSMLTGLPTHPKRFQKTRLQIPATADI
jgi:hypothetical protein